MGSKKRILAQSNCAKTIHGLINEFSCVGELDRVWINTLTIPNTIKWSSDCSYVHLISCFQTVHLAFRVTVTNLMAFQHLMEQNTVKIREGEARKSYGCVWCSILTFMESQIISLTAVLRHNNGLCWNKFTTVALVARALAHC